MHDYYRIADALDFIASNKQDQPDLKTVADHVHLSPFHFQRLFSDWAGVSPKKFLQYVSIEHAKSVLREQKGTVYDAAFDIGLSGTGRLHDLFVNIEGMTPGQYKNGGAGLSIQYSLHEGAFGNYLVASTGTGICAITFFERSAQHAINELKEAWPKAKVFEGEGAFHSQVEAFFNRKLTSPTPIKLHLKGTDFQLKVWEALLKIPETALTTYAQLAQQIDRPQAHRAVGTAVGNNPIAYLIPCHRVIRSVGEIGGYKWGNTRKTAILGWEQAQTEAVQP